MNSAQIESAAPSTPRPDALMPGARLEEFQIERVIGASGFGVIYLANDEAFERHVAIKEYLPDTLAVRGDDGTSVQLRAATHAEAFERGRRAFLDEAQVLERCNHPSLLHVLRSWEANGTVYRAMPYYPGHSILALRQALDEPPDEASLRALLDGLLDALEELHRTGAIHREIAPANILLLPDDRPVLMDFGAARRAIVGDQARALMTLLAPSFAPVEQTAPAPDRPQGPWTDLYALAAVIKYCISGELPPPASLRSPPPNEPMGRVAQRVQQSFPHRQYSPSFLTAIDAALAIRPQERPQSVSAFRARLDDHPMAVYAEPELDAPATDWGPGPTDSEPLAEPEAVAAPTVPFAPAMPPAPPVSPPAPAPRPQARATPPAAPAEPPPAPAPRPAAPIFAAATPSHADPWPQYADPGAFAPDDPPIMRATPVPQTRGRAHRGRRRVAWAGGLLLLFVAGAAAWLLDQERQTTRAQSEFAQAARQDGLTANVPVVPRSPAEDDPAPGAAPPSPAEASPAVELPAAASPAEASPAEIASADAAAVDAVRPQAAAVPAATRNPQPTPLPQAPTAAITTQPTPAAKPPPVAAEAPRVAAPQPAQPPVAAAPQAATPAADTAAAQPSAPPVVVATIQPNPVPQVAAVIAEDPPAATGRAATPSRSLRDDTPTSAGKQTAQMAPVRTATPKAVPTRTAAPTPASPREVCGERTQFSLYRCMQTQCAQSRWRQHAHCKLLRARDEVAF